MFALVPERRRPQKSQNPNSYYIVPWFVSIDGIGNLYGLVGGIANLLDSGTNLAAVNFQNSKFHIRALALDDLFLLGNYESWSSLTLSLGQISTELIELDAYEVGSDSSDEPFQVDGSIRGTALQLQWKGFTDRVKVSYEAVIGKDSIRLADQADFGIESEYARNRYKVELDLTDDRYDSRAGIRAIWILSTQDPNGNFLAENETEAEFDIYSREVSVFIPLGDTSNQHHTLALNYYLSTLHNKNEEIALNRRDGNTLGGPVRMRGYPNRRFVDLHTLYYGAEYRWTLKGDFGTSGGNFVLSNDVLEGLQMAFFHEWGQVAEFADSSLYSDLKTNYGIGLRAVWQSSLVMRLDVGVSEEGTSPTFIVLQPF